jgi:hypothetical protein
MTSSPAESGSGFTVLVNYRNCSLTSQADLTILGYPPTDPIGPSFRKYLETKPGHLLPPEERGAAMIVAPRERTPE